MAVVDTFRTALIINASRSMAESMNDEVAQALPGCHVVYAPTIATARCVLSRGKIDLVVSSMILPDGNVSKLNDIFSKMDSPPTVIVVGNVYERPLEVLRESGYQCASLQTPNGEVSNADNLSSSLQVLGADIRNDLNNPLQEIVAMVFVAQSDNESNELLDQALGAIEKAAKNMANVVSNIEDKIRGAVGGSESS